MLTVSALLHRAVSLLPPPAIRWLGRAQFRYPALGRLVRFATARLTARAARISFGPAAGMEILSADSNPGYALGTTEPEVQQFLATHLGTGEVFYDIGANVGFFTLIGARSVGPSGRVYAFEPLPANAAALRHNAELNDLSHVEVIEAAVSASTGKAVLALGRSTQDGHLLGGSATASSGTIEVSVVSLDDLVEQGRIGPPALVKIDAEGAEFEVMSGMRRLLGEHRPTVVCEVHGGGRPADAIRLFGQAFAPIVGGGDVTVTTDHDAPVGTIARSDYQLTLLEAQAAADTELWTPHVVARPLSPNGTTRETSTD